MVQDSASRKLDQYIVRFPDGMRNLLKAEAAKNKRSLNAEIVARLEDSLSGAASSELYMDHVMSMNEVTASKVIGLLHEAIRRVEYMAEGSIAGEDIDALEAATKAAAKD